MVPGIRLFGVIDCAGHKEPETVLHEQTVEISLDGDSVDGCRDADFADKWVKY